MHINHNNHSQFELFPSSERRHPSVEEKGSLPLKDLTLSAENIIVLCIVLVMGGVLFFSFGVERGRRLVSTDQGAQPLQETQVVEKQDAVKLQTAVQKPAEPVGTSAEPVLKENEEILKIPEIKKDEGMKPYTIQVASFQLESNAEKEADRLKDVGPETFVLKKGKYSIVCVGRFSEHQEAKRFSSRLKDRYRDLLVRRY